jgi:hypothetical protein
MIEDWTSSEKSERDEEQWFSWFLRDILHVKDWTFFKDWTFNIELYGEISSGNVNIGQRVRKNNMVESLYYKIYLNFREMVNFL